MLSTSPGLLSLWPEAQANSRVFIARSAGCMLYIEGTDLVSGGCDLHTRNGSGATASSDGSISGGYSHDVLNTAAYSGGGENRSSGEYTSITAGRNNEVSGEFSSDTRWRRLGGSAAGKARPAARK